MPNLGSLPPLQMFEDIIQQWQDNSLNLADYGLGFIPEPISRMDVFKGPSAFQVRRVNKQLKSKQTAE